MRTNRVVQAAKEGRPSFGVYVQSASTDIIELLGFAGLDYVRIDMDGSSKNLETIHHMIHTAHAVGITPFVRVPSVPGDLIDEGLIDRLIGMGAMGIQIPRAIDRAFVEAAVRAVKGGPLGDRKVLPGGFHGGYGQVDYQEYLDWANEHIMVTTQVETKSGIEAVEEIASIPGLDMLQSGRGDLSYQYGLPGQQYHPTIVAAQDRMIEAGLKAGKLVSVTYPTVGDPKHIDTVKDYLRRGVQVMNVGSDADIVGVFRRLLADLKA